MKLVATLLAAFSLASMAHAQDINRFRGSLNRVTYLGGSNFDTAFGIVQAPDLSIYVTGTTNSPDFPVTAGVVQGTYGGGGHDIFVAHLSANLKHLLGATFIGGSGNDAGFAITYDHNNNMLYILGSTTSIDFPGTQGRAQPDYAGGGDSVVIRLTRDLHDEVATYLGGSGDDTPDASLGNPGTTSSIQVSPHNGLIYVAGQTSSVDFPRTDAGAQSANAGGYDGFVAAVSPDLHLIGGASYFGGSGHDHIYAMAFDPDGRVYVTGVTTSPDLDHTGGGFQDSLQGAKVAFVGLFQPDLKEIVNASYLGGTALDAGTAVAEIPLMNTVYVYGNTTSHDFPKTQFGAQPVEAGGEDAFVAAVSRDLSAEYAATYLGGDSNDSARPAIGVSPEDGSLYVIGTTSSLNFPHTSGGLVPNYPGGVYASYVTHFTLDLLQIVQSTYFGGSTSHTGFHTIIADPYTFLVYGCGGTGANDLPDTQGAYDPTYNGGGRDATVTVMSPTLRP